MKKIVWAFFLLAFLTSCEYFTDPQKTKTTTTSSSGLPRGESGFTLGMTVEQFKSTKISYAMFESSRNGRSYYDYRITSGISDVRMASLDFGKASQKLENIHISYDDAYSTERNYKRMIKQMEKQYGAAANCEEGFTASCVWQDKTTRVKIGFKGGGKPDLFKEYEALR